jgi:tol-pal system protein YbgF
MQMKINHYLHKTTAAMAAVVFVASACLTTPAFAFMEDGEARRAILEVRSQLSNSQNSHLQMQRQLDELSQDNAKLQGRADLLEKQVEELLAQQKTFYGDLNNRLKTFEPQILEIEGVQGQVFPGEKEAYEAALKAFQEGSLKKAESGFGAFVKKYPSSPYWPLAQFWLGNAEYGQKDYKSAITTLQALVKKHPLHGRIPDALLTLGNSQIDAGQKPAAKKTLESLVNNHPESEAAELAKQALKRFK